MGAPLWLTVHSSGAAACRKALVDAGWAICLQQEVKGCFFHFAQALNWTIGLLLYARGQLHPFFYVSLICTTSMEAAKVTAPNPPRVDELCNIL